MKKSHYQVPENYFDQKKSSLKSIPHQQGRQFQIKPWIGKLAIAASLLIGSGLFVFNFFQKNETSAILLSAMSEESIEAAIATNPYSYFPESYIIENDQLNFEEIDSDELFSTDELILYLNEYTLENTSL
jgi:hypothetical protein